MMTLNDFNSSIRLAYEFAKQFNILENCGCLTALPRSDVFNKLSLSTQNYNEIYESALRLSHYNFLLSDLSFFQFSFKDSEEWALAYYPNPRVTGCERAIGEFFELKKAAEIGEISAEEFSELAETIPAKGYIPRVRFEYSARQYKRVIHPGAHFHIGMSGQDRWCSARKLSPRSFCYLMVKFYLPDVWWPNSRFSLHPDEQDREANIESCLDQMLINSMQHDGVSQHLSEAERLGFHFNAFQAR